MIANNFYVHANGTNDYQADFFECPIYYEGLKIRAKVQNANTGPCTFQLNLLTPISIKKNVSDDLGIGDLIDNLEIEFTYDGTNFQVTSVLATTLNIIE